MHVSLIRRINMSQTPKKRARKEIAIKHVENKIKLINDYNTKPQPTQKRSWNQEGCGKGVSTVSYILERKEHNTLQQSDSYTSNNRKLCIPSQLFVPLQKQKSCPNRNLSKAE